MRTATNLLLLVTVPLGLVGCGDDGTGPDTQECDPETSSVTVTVTGSQTPTFNWEPACPVAMVLVEGDAGDMWGFVPDPTMVDLSTFANWAPPEDGNRIQPPITYGVTPAGFHQVQPPEALDEGTTYEFILWRILPAGSNAECEMRIGNGCLLTVHTFVP